MNLLMYLLVILVVILNSIVEQNDSKYVPKSQRKEVQSWMSNEALGPK